LSILEYAEKNASKGMFVYLRKRTEAV